MLQRRVNVYLAGAEKQGSRWDLLPTDSVPMGLHPLAKVSIGVNRFRFSDVQGLDGLTCESLRIDKGSQSSMHTRVLRLRRTKGKSRVTSHM